VRWGVCVVAVAVICDGNVDERVVAGTRTYPDCGVVGRGRRRRGAYYIVV